MLYDISLDIIITHYKAFVNSFIIKFYYQEKLEFDRFTVPLNTEENDK